MFKCTVLAVHARFTDYTTQLFTILYCRLHESVLQSLFTIGSDPVMSCVGAVCLSLSSSKDGYDSSTSYSSTICDWLTSVEIRVLTDMYADRKQDTLVRGWRFNRNVFVTTETFVNLTSTANTVQDTYTRNIWTKFESRNVILLNLLMSNMDPY
jgi:hypothetical protein